MAKKKTAKRTSIVKTKRVAKADRDRRLERWNRERHQLQCELTSVKESFSRASKNIAANNLAWNGVECRRAAVEHQMNEMALYLQLAMQPASAEGKDEFLKKAWCVFRRPPALAEQERAAAAKVESRSVHPLLTDLINENESLKATLDTLVNSIEARK